MSLTALVPSYKEICEVYETSRSRLKEQGFTRVGIGSFREVYVRDKKIVIKIPTCVDGVIDNRMEHIIWHRYRSNPTERGIFVAPCRLMSHDLLMMVFVDDYYCPNEAYTWRWYDTCQAGLYKGGAVAFDYALECYERLEYEKSLNLSETFFQQSWLYKFSKR